MNKDKRHELMMIQVNHYEPISNDLSHMVMYNVELLDHHVLEYTNDHVDFQYKHSCRILWN